MFKNLSAYFSAPANGGAIQICLKTWNTLQSTLKKKGSHMTIRLHLSARSTVRISLHSIQKLPHEGMLYFFAALDEWLGYESATHNGLGEWPKGHFVVKYAKAINFETFRSCILVDDEDNPLTDPELEIVFSECADDAQGHKLLGVPFFEDVRNENPEMLNLLQIDDDEDLGIRLYDCGNINLLMKPSDLGYGNWKKTKAYMHSL